MPALPPSDQRLPTGPMPDRPVEMPGIPAHLVAMVVKADGFHFMRRDSRTGNWSQKNGGGNAEVETTATLIPVPGNIARNVPLTDAVAVELLGCATARYMGFAGFRFAGYVLVPDAGITVRGGS